MGVWYVRFEHADQYREVWCQADSKKEAISRAEEQDYYFERKNDSAHYKRTRVEEIPAQNYGDPTVVETPAPKRRWFRRNRGTST